MQMYFGYQAEESVPILEDLLSNTTDPEDRVDVMFTLSEACQWKCDRQMQKYWMARSSAEAIRNSLNVQSSLYDLSNLLFEEKDLERASRYCKVAMEDALRSGYGGRILNASSSQLTIARAVEEMEKRDYRISIYIIIALALLSLALTALLALLSRQRNTINDINARLEDANKIKEGYLYKYMNMSIKYLDSVEDLRRSVRKAMRDKDSDAIYRLLRDPRYNRPEYDRFYEVFDETFLGIYPDFVDKVNALLREEEHFCLREGGRRMPTGLRILAAIKLGFTDSGSIAEFLSCAPSSVYTHRSKIKKAALCGSGDFEKIIREL